MIAGQLQQVGCVFHFLQVLQVLALRFFQEVENSPVSLQEWRQGELVVCVWLRAEHVMIPKLLSTPGAGGSSRSAPGVSPP